jgi:hypothetical protein
MHLHVHVHMCVGTVHLYLDRRTWKVSGETMANSLSIIVNYLVL